MVFADVFSITQDTLYTAKAEFISFHGSISLLVECRDNFLDGVVVGVHLEDQPDAGGAGRINDKVLCFVDGIAKRQAAAVPEAFPRIFL